LASRSWEDLACEGMRLGQAHPLDRWAIGDLCVEAIPAGSDRAGKSEAQRQLDKFAIDTGISISTLKDCYRTSLAWPPGTRFPEFSQARHSTYAARPNRIDLLLNDEMDDGLSARIRDKVHKVEVLLGDAEVRSAIIERSRSRGRRITAAARAVEDEQLAKARAEQKIQEANARAELAAPEFLARMAERAIKGNLVLAKMVTELLDLKTVVDQIPFEYHERTTTNLEQIRRAAEQVLNVLRPETRSPQPRDVIDIDIDDQSGTEHR
jgi:hypothetical protein